MPFRRSRQIRVGIKFRKKTLAKKRLDKDPFLNAYSGLRNRLRMRNDSISHFHAADVYSTSNLNPYRVEVDATRF